jgi:hypothetical protein
MFARSVDVQNSQSASKLRHPSLPAIRRRDVLPSAFPT